MPQPFAFMRHVNQQQAVTGQELESEPPYKRPRRAPWSESMNGQVKKDDLTNHGSETEEVGCARWQSSQEADRSSLPDSEMVPGFAPSICRPLDPLQSSLDRQELEQREGLHQCRSETFEQHQRNAEQRRNLSASPSRPPRSPQPALTPTASAPAIGSSAASPACDQHIKELSESQSRGAPGSLPPLQIPINPFYDGMETGEDVEESEEDRALLEDEYDRRWILNLSMHFRDNSNREKFFVTYAETPSRWRRLTVSLDYSDPIEGSLEADLSTLHFQRDKSFRIYEAIRESLPDIQYYDTVTNLKLETTAEDGQLHVHVREDANEIVQYPSTSLFRHVRQVPLFHEDRIDFVSHMSGFVYKVQVDGRILIKKEIPGPDTVDEFLYEVNALDSLLGCRNVVQLEGLVTDGEGSAVKGLLISYASQGALVDLIYDFRGKLPWHQREKWAKQIVQGLSDIHEAGFVQGDFTLSNIVIDENDNAQIIDINRRGCPVGWEPPELGKLIDSGQRIGMHIGVKTDLYQLGMVLWALAEESDEPERAFRPLKLGHDVPSYYREMVNTCLSNRPQDRLPATNLLRSFPLSTGKASSIGNRSVEFLDDHLQVSDHSISTAHRSDKEYIDPSMAVTIDEVRRRRRASGATDFTSGQVTYVDPDSNAASTDYNFEPSGSWDLIHRRRGPSPASSRRRPSSPYGRSVSSATSISSAESAAKRLQRHAMYADEDEQCAEIETLPEPAFAAGRSPSIGADKLRASEDTPHLASFESYASRRACVPPCLPADPRLSETQAQAFPAIASLPHTDSGFDEHMIDEIDLSHERPAPVSHKRLGGASGDEASEFLPMAVAELGIDEAATVQMRTAALEGGANRYENHELRQE